MPFPDPAQVGGLELSRLKSGWALSQQGAKTPITQAPAEDEWMDIQGAGTVASVLRDLGHWRLDDASQDFDTSIWWFRLSFDSAINPGAETTPTAQHSLNLEGLASHCDIWFNGQWVLHSSNMFTQHRLDIDGLLKPDGNVLLLRFDALINALGRKRPRPRWRTPMVAHQQLRWHRTTLLGRTPGWSPPAAPVGPWRPIWLESRQVGQLVSSDVMASMDGDDGVLTVCCRFEGHAPPAQRLQLNVTGPDGPLSFPILVSDSGVCKTTARLPNVTLWWPHTHGTPVRYLVSLRIMAPGCADQVIPLRHVGFRKIERVKDSHRFGLQVNHNAVFCRGACWMPLDVVSLQADAPAYRTALEQVRDAGMNMLRIPGSTVYETRPFFDLCDELGILVWQDLMFSNMDYPTEDDEFLQSARSEVNQQLAWMTRHPSLVVVCGNSEVSQQAAMWGADKALWHPAFFHDQLPHLVGATGANLVYWPSSAHGGAFPHQPESGTCSYYGVGAYKRELADGIASGVSFATECLALANIPPDSTLRRSPAGEHPQVHSPAWKSRVYRDLSVGWDFDDVREHYVERLLGVRPDDLRSFDPARHLTLGRAVGAELMGRTMAAWRISSSPCAGALVWYLRDLWAGAGCGLVDDQGAPKAVLHALARVQQAHLAVVEDRGLNGLMLHLINETPQPEHGQVEVVLYRQGDIELARRTLSIDVAARSQGQWPLTDWMDGFMDLNWSYRFGPVAVDLIVVHWRGTSGRRLGQALHFDTRQLIAFNGPPGLTASAVARADGSVTVDICTRAAAYGIHFESFGWQASDEFFHLPPGATRRVHFTPSVNGSPLWFVSLKALNDRAAFSIPLNKALV